MSDPILDLFSTSINRTSLRIGEFVDGVNKSYSGVTDEPVLSDIIKSRLSGSYTTDGSYEPFVDQQDLGRKLTSLVPSSNLNLTSIRDDTYGYVKGLYGSPTIGLSAPQTQTLAGDLAKPQSIFINASFVMSGDLERSASVTTILSGDRSRTFVEPTFLAKGMNSLQRQLKDDYNIDISISQTEDGRLSVRVPDIEILSTGEVLLQSGERDLLRSKSKTFEFAATVGGGILDLPSYRYIGASYLGKTEQSAVETTVGIVRTYVMQQPILLQQARSLAFRQFLQDRQTYSSSQQYLEIDKFLGKLIGADTTFSSYVNTFAERGAEVTAFREMLKARFLSLSGSQEYSQVSAARLADIYSSGIDKVLRPLGNTDTLRQGVGAKVVSNLAQILLDPQIVTDITGRSLRVDAFANLKQAILTSSWQGNLLLQSRYEALLKQQIQGRRKNLIEQLMSPYLQPHEANFSGAQQLARRAYYLPDRSPLTLADGSNSLLQLGGTYKHGSGSMPIGVAYAGIAAQTSNLKIYDRRHHDSQLESMAAETTTFYDIATLFSGSKQLATTTLDKLGAELDGYKDKEDWLKELQQKLYLETSSQSILLVPYRKAEQIPQRLKNLTGTKPAIEYSSEFYKDLLQQNDLSKYYESVNGKLLNLRREEAISANVDTVLAPLQFAALQTAVANGEDPTTMARINDANPQAELRGFATNSKLKRVLIGTGLHQLSDFMHVNAKHQSYYGYEQYTKIQIESVSSYDAVGGKLHAANIASDRQRALLQKAFAPGRFIYYGEQELLHAKTLNAIDTYRNNVLQSYLDDSDLTAEQLWENKDVRKAVNLKVKDKFKFIRGISLSQEGAMKVTLQPGLYGFDDGGSFTQYGTFDGDSSRLYVALAPYADEKGAFTKAARAAIKISGRLRDVQEAVAVTNDILNFTELDGRLVGHVSYTILFNGAVRPGVENVKGPARFDESGIFDYYDRTLSGLGLSSRTANDNEIYSMAASASLKGFNYESGLDVLTTADTAQAFVQRLRTDKLATALFANYFTADLSSKSKDPVERLKLEAQSQKLKALLTTSFKKAGFEDSIGSSDVLTKNAGLFINNSGLFNLIDSKTGKYSSLGTLAPVAQLQETLVLALEAGDNRFIEKVVGLFTAAGKDAETIKGVRSFNQGSATVRAASVVSSLFGLSLQVLDSSRQQIATAPLLGSKLELNLIDRNTGLVNEEILFGQKHSQAAMDLLFKSKAEFRKSGSNALVKETEIYKLKEKYRAGNLTDRDRSGDVYQAIVARAADVYAASEASIPFQIGVRVAPSKIQQAAGSSDSANLEYHYSLALSKQQIDRMRGYVSDPNELTEVAAAYRLLVKFANTGGVESVNFISPFAGSQSVVDYRMAIGGLKDTSQIHASLGVFGENNYFDTYARAVTSGDASALERLATTGKLLGETISFYSGSESLQLRERALALAGLFDRRRLDDSTGFSGRKNELGTKFVFFDIETSGLMDKRFPKSDPRYYPSDSISEIAFVFSDGQNRTEIAWQANKPGQFDSLNSALQEVTRLLSGSYRDAALVGHNVREFDIPTLTPEFAKLGLDLSTFRTIDTVNDVDRPKLKREIASTKHSLGNVYKASERVNLRDLARAGDENARALLASGDYGTYMAHEALADVNANIQVFEFLRDKDLFRTSESGTPLASGDVLFEGSRVSYFDAASGSEFYQQVKALATTIADNAGGAHIGWFIDRAGSQYLDLANQVSSKGDVVYEHALNLLKLSSSQSGSLRGGAARNLSALLDRYALESDIALESKIAGALGYNESSHIENLRAQALSFKKAEVGYRLSGDNTAADKAARIYDTLHTSRAILMPQLQALALDDGNYHVKFLESGVKGKALLGQSLLYLGNDILTQLPTEFENFVPRIIRHRRELDEILPNYFEVIEKIQKSDGTISSSEFEALKEVQRLAIVNRSLVDEALAGALAQRSFGEKTKTSGVSSTAVASYLLGGDELALGSRFTSALTQSALRRLGALEGKNYGKDTVLVLRAGGPSAASQLDQSYSVMSVNELNQAAKDMGTAVVLDSKRNATTVLLPIYGRFSSQGGDFDGDSYAVIGRYEKEIHSYVDLLEQKKERDLTRKHLQKRMSLYEEYFVPKYAKRLAEIEFKNERSKIAKANAIKESLVSSLEKLQKNEYVDADKLLHNIYTLQNPEFLNKAVKLPESPAIVNFSPTIETISERTKSTSTLDSLNYFLGLTGEDLNKTHQLLIRRTSNSKQFAAAIRASSPFAKAIEFLDAFERRVKKDRTAATARMLQHSLMGMLDRSQDAVGAEFVTELVSKYSRIEPQHLTTSVIGKRLREAEAAFIAAASVKDSQEWQKVLEKNQHLVDSRTSEFILDSLKLAHAQSTIETLKANGGLELVTLPEISQAELEERSLGKRELATEKLTEVRNKHNGYIIGAEEVEFLKSQISEIDSYDKLTSKALADKKVAIGELLEQTEAIGKTAEAGMRRHVAAYTGIPLAFLSEEARVFSSARVYNAIEQHRGVLPGLEDLDKSVTNAGDLNLRTIESVAEFHRGVLKPIALKNDNSPEFLAAARTSLLAGIENYDGKVRTALRTTIENSSTEALLAYSHTELLDKTLMVTNSETALSGALAGIAKFVSNAGGTALSNKAFTALSMTIGAAGTNLIGEAYNAITLLGSKASVARALSEVYTNGRVQSTYAEADGDKFTSVMTSALERAFPAGGDWENSFEADKARQAKELLVQTFANPERLGAASFNRAQALTGMLANVQQSIRDSLKQKLDRGMLDSIMTERTYGDMTAYDLLTSEYTTDEERLPALRKFLGQDAGESIFHLPGETTQQRSKVTAFGALFLLNDYLGITSTGAAEKLIGLNGKGDGSYEFLRQRYERMQMLAKSTGDSKYAAMLEPDAFVAHSVIDLLAMSTAQRSAEVMAFKEVDFESFRNLAKASFVSDGSGGSVEGFTAKALQDVRLEYGLGDGLNERAINAAESLYFDPVTGADLLQTAEQRIAAAKQLGLDTDGSEASFNAIKENFWQRATTNFIYHNLKATGITAEDLVGMRETAAVIKHLRFDSIEGATEFRDFVNRSSLAIEGLLISSTRDQITDPRQRAVMSYEAGSQLFAAMHDVKERIESTYGKGVLDSDGGVPIETMRAYRQAEQVAGIFNNMLSDADSSIKAKASEMFAIAMAKGDGKTSGWQELSHFLGGVAQMRKSEDSLMFSASAQEAPSLDAVEFSENYSKAKEAGTVPEFLIAEGAKIAARSQKVKTAAITEANTKLDADAKTAKTSARHSMASAFLAPGLALFITSSQTDSNLTEHAYGAAQAVAQVAEMGEHRRWSSAALFQVDRLRQTVASEGKVFGTLKGVTSEILFESISRLSHRVAGSDIKAGGRSYLAELGTALLATVASSLTTDRRFGARGEAEEDYQVEALRQLPSLAIGTADAAIEDFLNSTSLPVDSETEVEYTATLKVGEDTLAGQFASGWLKANPFRDLDVEVEDFESA